MAESIILSIKNAESEAEDIKRKSLDEAKQILSEANNQAYKHFEQSIVEAEKEAKKIVKNAEQEAEKEIEKHRHAINKECTNILIESRKKLDKAVETIKERIVNIHGDS